MHLIKKVMVLTFSILLFFPTISLALGQNEIHDNECNNITKINFQDPSEDRFSCFL